MGKSERLEALKETLDVVLPNSLMNYDAKVMLFTFINGYKILRYRKDSKGLKRAWYTLIAVPMFIDGFIRDVRVNSTTGKLLFGELSIKDKYFGLSTLTGTLIRVKESHKMHVDGGDSAVASYDAYYHVKYGRISVERYDLACQICDVLCDYDSGHC